MKLAARLVFVGAMLFAALTVSAYSIAVAAPSSSVGQFLESLGMGTARLSPSDGRQSSGISEGPEATTSETNGAMSAETDETLGSDETIEASETPEPEEESELNGADDGADDSDLEEDTDVEDAGDTDEIGDQSDDGASATIAGISAWVTSSWND